MDPCTPSRRDGVRLDAGATSVLRAWADLDRFELPEVPTSQEKGWAAVGEIPRWEAPRPWPPRPSLAPERLDRHLEPMFSVANEIAYAGEMIHGRPHEDTCYPMGLSRWIDLARPDGAHFRTEDAEQVLALLRALDWAVDQSVAIISPFKEVVRGLRRPVEREVLALLPPERQTKEEREKALESVKVGTVHTFQGQEKTAVVLVLGGGSNGARAWAAGSPNLLNVAVTRAKDRLYVIGDRSKWADVGHARTLAEWLPSGPD